MDDRYEAMKEQAIAACKAGRFEDAEQALRPLSEGRAEPAVSTGTLFTFTFHAPRTGVPCVLHGLRDAAADGLVEATTFLRSVPHRQGQRLARHPRT